MKARREHIVLLPTQVVELLKAMYPIAGHTKFVFPNRDDRQRFMADATLRQALKKLGWATKYSPHGTRTTGSTRPNESAIGLTPSKSSLHMRSRTVFGAHKLRYLPG
ncbi:hypothetical protein [Bordetella avium]|uniref:hypothetical protein n=1 Tax=Bordetella avium TaxID=521 RepID=UPI000E1A23B9|nr:hypothetical protein [Bordetella avium]WQE33139.1 hypothetical protein U0029_14775 [Bordetella avium]SUV70075.1 integrase [Bordetella avium]